MPENADLQRLREEYAKRDSKISNKNLYSFFNPAYLFTIQQRERSILDVLSRCGFETINNSNLLEIGCGSGSVLLEFVKYGIDPKKIHGIDLLYNRLSKAKDKLTSSHIINADGQDLPYSNNSFDLVLQFTAFSSVLDEKVKHNMAADILRILKPKGAMLWYDFWFNLPNPQTKGIRPAEIRELFPNCTYEFHKITLATPIARRIVPISWFLAEILESIKIFNTHYLVLIQKNTSSYH